MTAILEHYDDLETYREAISKYYDRFRFNYSIIIIYTGLAVLTGILAYAEKDVVYGILSVISVFVMLIYMVLYLEEKMSYILVKTYVQHIKNRRQKT